MRCTPLALLLAAPWAPAQDAAAPPPPFELVADGFTGGVTDSPHRSFDVIATDADLDGDTDVLVNWHHLLPLELYENVGGTFHLWNVPGDDPTGLDDAYGIASLFGEEVATRAAVDASEAPGVYVWHDPVRQPTRWHVVWKPGGAAARLELELNREISALEGLDDADLLMRATGSTGEEIVVRLDPAKALAFTVETKLVATRLELDLPSAAGSDEEAPMLFVGRELTPRAPYMPVPDSLLPGSSPRTTTDAIPARLSVWKPDPHGMAWVDQSDSSYPDLYITRGGLRGELRPPLAPKTDRWFSANEPYERSDSLYYLRSGAVPPDFARGRSVEWVNLEGRDNPLMLSISARDTANRLLGPTTTARLADFAPLHGLDLESAEVQTWCDVNGDARDDLLFLAKRRVDVLLNIKLYQPLEPVDGTTLGLALPKAGRQVGLFDNAALHPVDLDLDGELDLLVTGYGRYHSTVAFLREGDGFVDATERLGLDGARSYEALVILDADGDGDADLVTLGPVQRLWRNDAGARFAPEVIDVPGLDPPIESATTCDADGDGRTDLVLVSSRVSLLRNVAAAPARLDVILPALDIGTLVRVRYASGRARVQRHGSAFNTAVSQALQPLRFGEAPDDPIVAVEVRWVGAKAWRTYALPEEGTRELTLRSGD